MKKGDQSVNNPDQLGEKTKPFIKQNVANRGTHRLGKREKPHWATKEERRGGKEDSRPRSLPIARQNCMARKPTREKANASAGWLVGEAKKRNENGRPSY